MRKMLTAVALSAAVIALGALPALADRGGYYEWSTRRPFSGWVGVPPYSYYCDYIRYPVRECGYRTVCRHGKCYEREQCRIVGWDIRQSCY